MGSFCAKGCISLSAWPEKSLSEARESGNLGQSSHKILRSGFWGHVDRAQSHSQAICVWQLNDHTLFQKLVSFVTGIPATTVSTWSRLPLAHGESNYLKTRSLEFHKYCTYLLSTSWIHERPSFWNEVNCKALSTCPKRSLRSQCDNGQARHSLNLSLPFVVAYCLTEISAFS